VIGKSISYFVTVPKHMGDEAAYEVVKALWNYNQELGTAHPALKKWRRERMVSKNAFIPYHPGAIKLFREEGIWSKEMEELQSKLLSQ